MFYHQGILQKRGGKFGIIWLAATKIDNLKKRELSSISIQRAWYSPLNRFSLREAFVSIEKTPRIPTRMGGTRWLPHTKRALQQMIEGNEGIILHLEQMQQNPSKESSCKAKNFLKLLKYSSVQYWLYFMMDIVKCLAKVSEAIQEKNSNVGDIFTELEGAKSVLAKYKTSAGPYLRKVSTSELDQILSLRKEKLIDSLITAISSRFAGDGSLFADASVILTIRSWPDFSEDIEFGDEHVKNLVDLARPALKACCPETDLDNIETEWTRFKVCLTSRKQNVQDMTWPYLASGFSKSYPSLFILINYLLTLPGSSVDAERGFSCNEIIDYILVRVQPKDRKKSKPRFSLYLSSQLMYGVIRVFERQSEFLLGEASTFFTRLRLATTTINEPEIDLKGIFRSDLVTCPDMAVLDSLEQPGFDPAFGHMRMRASTEAKITYPELEMWRVESSLAIPRSPHLSPDLPQKAGSVLSTPKRGSGHTFQPELGSPHTVSSKEEITMQEVEMVIPEIEVQGEKDLPMFDGKELNVILDEPVDPKADWLNILSPVQDRTKETTDQMVQDITETLSPKEKTPFLRPDTEQVPERRDVTLSPGVTPIPRIQPVRAQRMRPSLTLQLTPLTPSPVRRRRRRQLFIDRETQISKAQLRTNMTTGSDTCQPLILPDSRSSTVKELFKRPGIKAIRHHSILPLWERNAKFGILETDSDRRVPIWSVPHLQEGEEPERKRRRISLPVTESVGSPTQQAEKDEQIQPMDVEVSLEMPSMEAALDMSSIEVRRGHSVSMEKSLHREDTPVSIHLSHSVLSEQDKSVKDSFTEETSIRKTRSSRKKKSQGGTSSEDEVAAEFVVQAASEASFSMIGDLNITGNLSVVREEPELVPISPSHISVGPSTEQIPSPDLSLLIRTINTQIREEKWTTFHDICPPQSFRSMAAKMFAGILDLCADGKLNCKQKAPFKEIYISKGLNWAQCD